MPCSRTQHGLTRVGLELMTGQKRYLLCHFTITRDIYKIPYISLQLPTGNSITLRLHYVPGDHGSHGSPKRSAPCDLVNFCLGTQVLLSIITFRHGLSRYPLQTVG